MVEANVGLEQQVLAFLKDHNLIEDSEIFATS
jgi:hypothetical protein